MSDEPLGRDPGADPLLAWPPPGLGRIKGDLWIVVRKLGVAAGVFVLPLLALLTVPEQEPGLGPLGDAWWVTVVTSLVGIGLFADGVVALVRLLLRVRTAMSWGYSARVVGLVVTDRDLDGGHLLQGAHAWSAVPEEVRGILWRTRLLAAGFHLAAVCWLAFGFGIFVVLAARGVLTPSGLLVWTLAPAALLGSGGLVLRAVNGSLARRARREWHRHPWSEELVKRDVGGWKARALEHGVVVEERPASGPGIHLLAAGLAVAALVAVLPPATLVPISSTGAVLAELASGTFGSTRSRAAEAEAYRDFRSASLPDVSAAEAGGLLNVLSWVGAEHGAVPGLRAPERRYDQAWFPDDPPESLSVQIPPLWSDTLWVRADDGLSEEELAYLRLVAAHPAHEDFSRLASASRLDFVRGMYETPFGTDVTLYDIPTPRMHGLRLGAQAHVAAAALHSAEGRHAEAERMAREVVSVGLLLLDESPILIGTLVGAVIASTGGDALRHALRRAGAEDRLTAFDAAVGAAGRAARVAGTRTGRASGDDFLRAAREISADTTAARGVRWEFAHVSTIATPCRNMRTIVFGPGIEYDRWLSGVRASLVRYGSEGEFFDVLSRGLARESRSASPVARFLTAAMGGGEGPESCARFIATIDDLR